MEAIYSILESKEIYQNYTRKSGIVEMNTAEIDFFKWRGFCFIKTNLKKYAVRSGGNRILGKTDTPSIHPFELT